MLLGVSEPDCQAAQARQRQMLNEGLRQQRLAPRRPAARVCVPWAAGTRQIVALVLTWAGRGSAAARRAGPPYGSPVQLWT
jgi:hypothetical protein